MSIENSEDCKHDRIEIIDLPPGGVAERFKRKFCTQSGQIPAPFILPTSIRSFQIKFKSDDSFEPPQGGFQILLRISFIYDFLNFENFRNFEFCKNEQKLG